jgi:hypothetical protein
VSPGSVRIHPAALEEAEAAMDLVVLRETSTGVEIIAVAHGRRRPGFWRDRVE